MEGATFRPSQSIRELDLRVHLQNSPTFPVPSKDRHQNTLTSPMDLANGLSEFHPKCNTSSGH